MADDKTSQSSLYSGQALQARFEAVTGEAFSPTARAGIASIAEKSGVSPVAVTEVLAGQAHDLVTIQAVANALGLKAEVTIFRKSPPANQVTGNQERSSDH